MFLTPARQRWAADLRWLFSESDGELGLRSNFGALVAGLEGGGHSASVSHEVSDRVMESAERARTIRRALESVPDWARVVLGVAFRRADGELALMAALTSAALEHRRSRTKRPIQEWLAKTRDNKSKERRRLYVQLRMEATDVVEVALDLYARAAREVGGGRREMA
jgi:hypothetical protein